MQKELNVAVVGATGAVGRVFLSILESSSLSIGSLRLLASQRSVGKKISFGMQQILVEEATPDSFEGTDVVFISASADVSRQLACAAVERGALVIDDSSAYRLLPEVPLVVPEVNGADVEDHRGIIAIPNCSTTQLVMAIYPLHRVNPVKRLIVDTYQAVSGAGTGAMDELTTQTQELSSEQSVSPVALPHRIAFNLFPQIGSFLANGYSDEEEKIRAETCKILHDPSIAVTATCVRVPVYTCHSEAVHVELEHPMEAEEAQELIAKMPGVTVMGNGAPDIYPMPWNLAGTDEVYVGRIRKDVSIRNGLAMWVVSDNLRKGAALNALQIAEEVLERKCLRASKSQRI